MCGLDLFLKRSQLFVGWHLAGNSGRDDLKFFAKDTEAFVCSDKAGTRWPSRVRPTV